VQDGEQLAVINDANSFSFILALPYELRNYLASNKTLQVLLPDSTKLEGYVASYMPVVDSVSQTQNVVIKVKTKSMLPENLIGKVRIIKTSHSNAVFVPKAAVLADETQSNFWVMKLIDSTTAVKVPVVKGIETDDKVEIKSPPLSTTDKILVTGNYGLPDTAKVSVTHD
jgi:multidrug efflux pump subunit AcrA (membrane-fusion protein)